MPRVFHVTARQCDFGDGERADHHFLMPAESWQQAVGMVAAYLFEEGVGHGSFRMTRTEATPPAPEAT